MRYFPNLIWLTGIFLSSAITSAQVNSNAYGTFITAFIGRDGIVVAADSRTVMYSRGARVAVYFEESSKIFQFQNCLIAVAGQYTFATTSISNLIKGLEAAHGGSKINLYAIRDSLLSYAHTKLSVTDYYGLIFNEFIIAGFEDHSPVILYYDGIRRKEIEDNGYITNLPAYNGKGKLKRKIRGLTLEDLIPLSISFVESVEKEKNSEDKWSIIGGPVSTASIRDGKVTWIRDQNRNNYESMQDLYTTYRDGKVQLFYRSAKDSVDFPNRFPH